MPVGKFVAALNRARLHASADEKARSAEGTTAFLSKIRVTKEHVWYPVAPSPPKKSRTGPSRPRPAPEPLEELECYVCGSRGHTAADCTVPDVSELKKAPD